MSKVGININQDLEMKPKSVHMSDKESFALPRPKSASFVIKKKARESRALSVDWEKAFGHDVVAQEGIHHGFEVFEKDTVTFGTGSTYKGGWNLLGITNFGTYTLPHKVEYEGQLNDGMFHGDGMYVYPSGQKVMGTWNKDVLQEVKYIFPDGLLYEEPWEYCLMPDRRFFISIEEGLQPADRENLTNARVPRTIPEGCYDCGDGFFNPRTKCVQSPDDPTKVLRIPSLSEEKWIVNNCRKAWDEPTGYRPDLYERWVSGRAYERYETSYDAGSPEGSTYSITTPADSLTETSQLWDDDDFYDLAKMSIGSSRQNESQNYSPRSSMSGRGSFKGKLRFSSQSKGTKGSISSASQRDSNAQQGNRHRSTYEESSQPKITLRISVLANTLRGSYSEAKEKALQEARGSRASIKRASEEMMEE